MQGCGPPGTEFDTPAVVGHTVHKRIYAVNFHSVGNTLSRVKESNKRQHKGMSQEEESYK